MARTKFTHACGHAGEAHDSSRKAADRRAEWSSQRKCWECERRDANQAAADTAAKAGLPELQGSEKQVAWANTIRLSSLAKFEEGAAALLTSASRRTEAARSELSDALALLRKELIERTSARDWIDDRETKRYADDIEAVIAQRQIAPTWIAELAARQASHDESKAKFGRMLAEFRPTRADVDVDADGKLVEIRVGAELVIRFDAPPGYLRLVRGKTNVVASDRAPDIQHILEAARALAASA